jgi:hypothetical protein
MDFDFTDDQEQLRDAVRKWVDKGYDFERRRGIANAGGFSREAYGELAELGLTGLYVPEADGGLGMGPVEAMVVMEELGRGIVEPWRRPDQRRGAGELRRRRPEGRLAAAHRQRRGPGGAGPSGAPALPPRRLRGRGQRQRRWLHRQRPKSIVPAGDQADAFWCRPSSTASIALFLVERSAPA